MTFSCGLFRMNLPVLTNPQELGYNGSVRTQVLFGGPTGSDGWLGRMEREKKSEKSVLVAWLDDDDNIYKYAINMDTDIYIYIPLYIIVYIYIYIYI